MVLKQLVRNNPVFSLLKRTGLYQNYVAWREERQFRANEERRNKLRIKIASLLPKGGVGAELGVFKGFFSPLLLEQTQAKKLHLVDLWYFLTPHWHWGGGNRSTVDALVNILQNFKQEIEDNRVLIHVGDDRKILAEFPDKYFDWVYIDSRHQYEHTREELTILLDKVKDDGVIAGDDWQPNPSHKHHGVCKAVRELIASTEYELLYADASDRQWAITRVPVRSEEWGKQENPNPVEKSLSAV